MNFQIHQIDHVEHFNRTLCDIFNAVWHSTYLYITFDDNICYETNFVILTYLKSATNFIVNQKCGTLVFYEKYNLPKITTIGNKNILNCTWINMHATWGDSYVRIFRVIIVHGSEARMIFNGHEDFHSHSRFSDKLPTLRLNFNHANSGSGWMISPHPSISRRNRVFVAKFVLKIQRIRRTLSELVYSFR